MKTKLLGTMILLAGTATVFAATHSSLNENAKPGISGVADITESLENRLRMELELVGLEPNTQYIARLENFACSDLPKKVSGVPSELFVATYIKSNQFGSYSTVFNGLPTYAKNTRSVALYSDTNSQENIELETVYCLTLG